MLEGLDEIGWSRMEACRDPALIPVQIRAIESGSAGEALAMAAALQDNILYQGSVFEATSQVVPFVGQLISGDIDIVVRLSLVGTLVELGHGRTFVEPSLWGSTLDSAKHEERVGIESAYVEATRRAVGEEADTLLSQLPFEDALLERAILALAHCSAAISDLAMHELERIAASGSSADRHRREIALSLARSDPTVRFEEHWTSVFELTTLPDSLGRLGDELDGGMISARGLVDIDVNSSSSRDLEHCVRRQDEDFVVFFSRAGERVAPSERLDEQAACEELRRRAAADPRRRTPSAPDDIRTAALGGLFALGYVADDLDVHGERLNRSQQQPVEARFFRWAWEVDGDAPHRGQPDFRAAEDPRLLDLVARWVTGVRSLGELEPWRIVTLDLVDADLRRFVAFPASPPNRETALAMRDASLAEMSTLLREP